MYTDTSHVAMYICIHTCVRTQTDAHIGNYKGHMQILVKDEL